MILILAGIMRETSVGSMLATMLARHWLLLAERQIFAAQAHFGAVYFILSALLLIILNLGTRNEGEHQFSTLDVSDCSDN